MAPRSLWNGTLSCAEVAIPVKLYAMLQPHQVRFREVRISDASRISHHRFGAESGKEIPTDQLARAYEPSSGQMIVMDDEELAVASGIPHKTLELESFVSCEQIDPIYFERPYLLGPQAGAEHSYMVMHDALARRGRAGIGRLVLRTRERLVAVTARDGALRVCTLRFADELVARAELELPPLPGTPAPKELALARQLIEALTVDWDPQSHQDHYREQLMKLIEAKAKGKEIKTAAEPVSEPSADLLSALEQSLEQQRHAARTRRAAPGSAAAKRPRARRR